MRRTITILTIGTSLLFGAVACGGDDDGGGGGGNDALVDQLVEELGAPREEAQCVVDILGDDATVFLEIAESGDEPDPELEALIVEALTECNLGE